MKFYYEYPKEINSILEKNNPQEIRQLFAIFDETPTEVVYKKCYLWIHWFFPQFFKKEECEEQINIIKNNCDLELGLIKTLTEVGFRGLGKTTTSKLVQAFFLANNHRSDRGKYYKVVSKDDVNARQVVTDLYNMLVSPRLLFIYSTLWTKTDMKRKETQSEFDLATGVKVRASTVERSQRGNAQMESRPDRVWFEDIEDAESVRSALKTQSIWKTMDEAYNGLSADGRGLYNVNYITKRGNVHKLILRGKRDPKRHRVHIVPIYNKKTGKITWYHSKAEILALMQEADDFDGDYMCDPKNTVDTYFNENYINLHPTRDPILVKDGWSYYAKRDPKHTYVIGSDPSGGNGGDFATIFIIDLTTGELVAHYYDRFTGEMKLGNILYEKGILYNEALIGVESNNHGHAVLVQLINRNYPNLYQETIVDQYTQKEKPIFGFNTNMRTKPRILDGLNEGINCFALRLPSAIIKEELVNFPREYADVTRYDPELGHFDGVMALAIAWEMRKHVGEVSGRVKDTVNNNVIIN